MDRDAQGVNAAVEAIKGSSVDGVLEQVVVNVRGHERRCLKCQKSDLSMRPEWLRAEQLVAAGVLHWLWPLLLPADGCVFKQRGITAMGGLRTEMQPCMSSLTCTEAVLFSCSKNEIRS